MSCIRPNFVLQARQTNHFQADGEAFFLNIDTEDLNLYRENVREVLQSKHEHHLF